MTTITLPTGTWLMVPVPDFTSNFHIKDGLLYGTTQMWEKDKQKENDWCGMLPIDHEFDFMNLASDLSEEQCQEVVERWASGKWNDYYRFLARVDTAKESLETLCAHHLPGTPLNQIVILKVNNPGAQPIK